MLSQADNELITRTGSGTPGGAFLRRFWHPVLLSDELTAGSAPRKVRLLGEDLVAFRGADGRLGLLDEACPHRRASLALAKNEDCALRCLYHGWKIDADGRVIETPSEPAGAAFAAKVNVRRYHLREAGTIAWAYIGPGEPPQFPAFPFTARPAAQTRTRRALVRCNWVQFVEGFLDSSHISHLHGSAPSEPEYYAMKMADGAPTFDIEMLPHGFYASATRQIGGGRSYTRVTEFILPNAGYIPAARAPGPAYDAYPESLLISTPIDEVTTLQWFIYSARRPEYVDNLFGNNDWVERSEADTLWGQDREKLQAGHASGLATLAMEDIAMAESQGPIADRSREYLGTSDSVIARYRRVLIDSIRRNAIGETPACLAADIPYETRQAHAVVHAETVDWREAIELLKR